MDWDHRISFTGDRWQHFIRSEHLEIGQAILITGRPMHTTTTRRVEIIFAVDNINDLDSGYDSYLD
jgi:hypothetical protein